MKIYYTVLRAYVSNTCSNYLVNESGAKFDHLMIRTGSV